ncbi:MAG: hypothetical protein LBB68_07855 [Treponema sp.]|nr:hypothetical protein [Treponema sp.]
MNLLPAEDGSRFDLVQERGGSRKLYEGCAVTAFELRILRGEAVKLKLDIRGERSPFGKPNGGAEKQSFSAPNFLANEKTEGTEGRERFMGDRVRYRINGAEYRNIYGLTVSVKKEGGTRTELRIKRVLEDGGDLPGVIEELTVTAQLLRDRYEPRHYGMFRITLKGLVLVSDETAVDCAGGVIGPLRYYVAGTVQAEVFTANGSSLE